MPPLRITNGFNKLSDANMEIRANTIIASLTANFNSAPGLHTLRTSRDAFVDALTAARDGSVLQKAIKNQRRVELIDALHLMGNYVLYTCAGDAVMAISSGFSIAREATPAPDVSKAENQRLEDGPNAGELRFSFDKVMGARSYVYQNAPDPITEASVWSSEMGTVRQVVFTGA